MAIDTTLSLLSRDKIKQPQILLDVQSLDSSGLFAAHLAEQMGIESTQTRDTPPDNRLTDDVNTLKKKGFTGFFKKMQEEKMKELREKILEEMGLTEEDLSKMPPEQRATIEKMIAKEMQLRMSAESALEDEKTTDSIQKRLLLTEL
jgi:hypothetical protein